MSKKPGLYDPPGLGWMYAGKLIETAPVLGFDEIVSIEQKKRNFYGVNRFKEKY